MFRANDMNAPKIVCDISDATVAAAIATMKTAIAAGADAFHLNISRLDIASTDELKAIFERIRVPVFSSNRRASFFAVYGESPFEPRLETDEERMSSLLRSIRLGGAGVDMEMDTFHAASEDIAIVQERAAGLASGRDGVGRLGEVTFDPTAIARQSEFLGEVKAAGGFSVMSCHTSRPMTADETLVLAEAAAARGADHLKIVVRTRTETDRDEIVRGALALRRRSPLPFVIMPMGGATLAERAALFMLGCAWVYSQPKYVPTGFDQQPLPELLVPMVRALRSS
jgi:hypothetical protein